MANRFDEGHQKLANQAGNPAAPTGARQLASSEQNRFSQGHQQLANAAPGVVDYTAQSQSWFTGANREDTKSGWDNEFVQSYMSGWDAALKDGSARNYFDSGTGVVTYDHDTEKSKYRFGDVVENGKVVSNVYDDYDETTAHLMMLPWLPGDGKAQARLFEKPDEDEIARRVGQYVTEYKEDAATTMEKTIGAMEFQGDVDATREDLQDGPIDELVAGIGGLIGGAVTGGSAGAVAGSIIPGAGTVAGGIVGAVGGGIAGFVGGLLNKDEIAESAARHIEITKMANEQNGLAGAASAGLLQAGQFSMKFTAPLSNLSRGFTDVVEGEWGDGVSQRYATDDKGESASSRISKVADWTALAGDSLMQFMSPLNRLIYTTQISTVIGGEVASLAANRGGMFDQHEGKFDNIFTDDDGGFDPVSASAGILKIGIDAVQLGGMRGLARASEINRGALGKVGEPVEMAGHRFFLDDAGKLVGQKKTMALLAPSEQVAYWSAARNARVAAMKEGRAVSADDFFRAADNLAHGSSKLRTAVVNAFGEGYEEGLQAILEPMALNEDQDFGAAAGAFAYGAAAGIGFSLGATLRAPGTDARMMGQAYVLDTLRNDGVERGWESFQSEWKALTQTEKRIRSTRTPADIAVTRAATAKIAREHTATMVESEVDAARAFDVLNKKFDATLKDATVRTDAYHVMAGTVDVGATLAESVQASARTTYELLANRHDGLGLQVEYLSRELEKADPDSAVAAELTERLEMAQASRAYGQVLLTQIRPVIEGIYADGTTEVQAQELTNRLNRLLHDVFYRSAELTPIEGMDPTALTDAAAHFVSLLHSREPKLDTGSYLMLLPQADWELTRTRSDNMVQVNTDVLASINGDFDGDKLRSENQLSLTRERFLQGRAGQNFAGVDRSVDVATRNFDAGLVVALRTGLDSGPGALKREADAAMSAIYDGLQDRYGHLMSPEALGRVWTKFTELVGAGDADARTALMDALAVEAGEAITNLGRERLRNEWLLISKIVREQLNRYQVEYRKIRREAKAEEMPTVDVGEVDTPRGTQVRKQRAATSAQTLSAWAEGTSLFRKFQKIHYTFFASKATSTVQAQPAQLTEMASLYRELAQNVTRNELDSLGLENSVSGRVLAMLHRLVLAAQETEGVGQFDPAEAMVIFANVKVKDVRFDDDGAYLVDNQDLSLAQLLLQRALEAEAEEHRETFFTDEKLQAKHARLRALTIPNKVAKEVNAERAFIEVFKAVPFGDSLGGSYGMLSLHSTPEQWLRDYISLDADGRRDMERYYTDNVPEYLSRQESLNLPYSFHEAQRGEITAYRSIIDAMVAVGRNELTFNPDPKTPGKVFGGRIGKENRKAAENFKAVHKDVRAALQQFSEISARVQGPRESRAQAVQRMFEMNPQQALQILDTIPDAATAALYEFRGEKMYVVPWIYDMFTIENAEEALFFYWKNLTLAQWNSTQVEGRTYEKLNSRFQRLLFQLSMEPGQMHYEAMIRKMDSAKNLDEFFVWLNSTPGYVSGQAPLLPFFDDVADFEADASGGGWTQVRDGSDLREALKVAKRAARAMRETMDFRLETVDTNASVLQGIMYAAQDSDAAKPEDRMNLEKFDRILADAPLVPRSFAPSSMLSLVRGAVNGFDAHSQDKGQVPTSYEGIGKFQAVMDAFAFAPGLERVMEVLTAHSLDSLSTNLNDVVRTSGVAMDANGRQIEWQPLTREAAIELLRNPETAPFAYALLAPTALDTTPTGLTEKLLTEASLTDLLDGNLYKELFESTTDNQLDTDTRYLSLLDSRARPEGGNFGAVRAAENLAIVMTSALNRPATAKDKDRITAQAFHHVARVLRMVGMVQSSPTMRQAGMLAELRKHALKELKNLRLSRALPELQGAEGNVVDVFVNSLKTELKRQYLFDLESVARDFADNAEAMQRRRLALKSEYDYNLSQLDRMLEDSPLNATVARYELTGEAISDSMKHSMISQYAMAMSDFPTRAPEAADAWTELAGMRRSGIFPETSWSGWDVLSRSIIGLELVDTAGRVAPHVAVSALAQAPKTEDGRAQALSESQYYKFWDPTYSYLVDDLLQENSPEAKAAVWLHNRGDQPNVPVPIKQLRAALDQTILDRANFGTWTIGLKDQLVATQERMDSSGGPPGIAAAGNGQKRWGVISAALRRSGRVPGRDELTTVQLTGDFLLDSADPFNEVMVQPAGRAAPTTMLVAQLDNRFYSSIRLDGEEISLDAENLGYTWNGAEAKNDYRYVALERLHPIVARYAQSKGVDPAAVMVELDFFHPDSQPAGDWHNAFFEGMSHSLLPDGSESLIATMWADNGGNIALATQWAIDAGKKGLRAIQSFLRPSAESLSNVREKWGENNDLAAMLQAKTELAVRYDDGSGAIGVKGFNAMYKMMKAQHIVVGLDENGNAAAMTADEVIAWQRENGTVDADGNPVPLPLDTSGMDDRGLVVLSPDVLRTMMGDRTNQGTNRILDTEAIVNPTLVRRFTGIDAATLRRFAWVDAQGNRHGWLAPKGGVQDTRLAHVGPQRVMRVRTVRTERDRDALTERRNYLKSRMAKATAARRRLDEKAVRSSYKQVLELAAGEIGVEQENVDFTTIGTNLIEPRDPRRSLHSVRVLERLRRMMDTKGLHRGWEVYDEGFPDFPNGVLTLESLHDKTAQEDRVVLNDVAALKLGSFVKPERQEDVVQERVEKALDFLVNSGAYVVLTTGDGTGDLRFHAAQYLESQGYVQIRGAKHLYGPAEFVYQTQNERAYESTMRETRRFRPARNAVTFLTLDPIETDENNAILNAESKKVRSTVMLNNLIPSSWGQGYNIPIEDNRDNGLYARTLKHLLTVLDPENTEARATLNTMGGKGSGNLMPLDMALTRLYDKLYTRGSLTPLPNESLLVGDIIPFVHENGKVMLYRHGFQLPKPREREKQLSENGLGVAVSLSKLEGRATANSGIIRQIDNRVGYGKVFMLENLLQPYGDKVQLEWNGMKYVLVPAPSWLKKIPKIFRNGTVVDLISDVASADSKEAYAGRVRGVRNALAFFQFDFNADLAKFFFPDAKESDADFAEKKALAADMLFRLADSGDFKLPAADVDLLVQSNVSLGRLLGAYAASEQATTGINPGWVDRLTDDTDPSAQIAKALVYYAMTPGANIHNVLQSSGFSDPRALSDTVETREVPGVFAALLDQGLDSPLHKELVRRFNSQLLRGADGTGFTLNTDWTVEMTLEDGQSVRGYLQYGEVHSSGDNPVLDGEAFKPGTSAGVSAHNALASNLSFGAMTAHSELTKYTAFAKAFTREGNASKFGEGGDGVWEMLTAIPDTKDLGLVGWRREQPAESARRAVARKEIAGLYQPIDTSEWNDVTNEAGRYHQLAVTVLNEMNMHGESSDMVDVWVRKGLGKPHEIDAQGNVRGQISFEKAYETLQLIHLAVKDGRLPTQYANIPLIDVNHLSKIYMANAHRENGWAPFTDSNSGIRASSWDSWVETAFGTAWLTASGKDGIKAEPRFHQMYLLAMDGIMHGYQGATSSTRYLPVSSDVLRQRMLMDPETNKMFVSISADENLLATDPTFFNSERAELEQIISGDRIYANGRDGEDPASAMGRQRAAHEAWHRENHAPRQVNKHITGVRQQGNTFIGYTTSTSALWRSMMNLRVGNTLFNAGLVAVAPVEAFYRRTINLFSNLALAESTGATGRAQIRLSEWLAGKGDIGAFLQELGFQTTYTSAQAEQLDAMVNALASLPEFKAMIYKEIAFQYPSVEGIGKIEKALEKYAKFGGKLQDPALGMLPRDLARIYVEAVMRKVSRDPRSNVYSIERLLTSLPRNPDWVSENDREAHDMAIASILQIRSLKPTPLSLAFRGFVEPLAANPNFAVNAAGNMLKILTAFQNFWANFGTTITGLQGASDWVAFLFDGRQKNITARMQAAIAGQKYDPTEKQYFNLTPAIESLDLTDAFIRGGVTHSALFALGMMAGGLGFSGEDDETKWRRRQAEIQGVPLVRDPRDIENDFRNKDAIFLDWLPFGLDSLFKVDPNNPESRSLAQMNWIARTFLSPIIGFERFYNTGDFTEVIHGFKDAIGSHPMVNEQLYNAAIETAADLHANANDAASEGDYEAGGHFLMTAVGVLEGMLLENSMVNMVYVGMDEWDRDPYIQPLRDSDGVLQRDIENQVRPNDLALRPFLNDKGEITEGYLNRSQVQADRRVLTENRATLAFVASMFTGGLGDSDYWRYNMPVKTREVDLPERSQDEVEALIKAAASHQMKLSGMANVTAEELMPAVRNELYQLGPKIGHYFTDDEVWAEARKRAATMGTAAMSTIDSAGRENLTDEGVRAMFRGLRKGTLEIGSPELANVGVPREMRDKIAEEWTTELVQEGINLGLDETQARKRMQRMMYGPQDSPNSGLGRILYDTKIPYSQKVVYGQLNSTYVMGPDARPWATGFKRDGLLGAAGIKPLRRMIPPVDGVTGTDPRGNTVDLVHGMNTGLRALVPFNDTRNVPTDKEIGDAIIDAIEKAAAKQYTPFEPFDKKGGGSGWRNFGRGSGWRNFGRGGSSWGSGGGGGAFFSRMYQLPSNVSPYGNNVPFINTSNPLLRRGSVRRERVWSERGRLKQWQ